jgi:hypothetical protein
MLGASFQPWVHTGDQHHVPAPLPDIRRLSDCFAAGESKQLYFWLILRDGLSALVYLFSLLLPRRLSQTVQHRMVHNELEGI